MATTTNPIPGTGLTAAELRNLPESDPARVMWGALCNLADIVGVSPFTGVIGIATKSVDALVADIAEAMPDNYDIAASALACVALSGYEATTYDETFEVRILSTGAPGSDANSEWFRVYVADTFEDADTWKTAAEKKFPEAVYVLVSVQKTTKVSAYPKGYQRRI